MATLRFVALRFQLRPLAGAGMLLGALLVGCKPKFGTATTPYLYTGPLVETTNAVTLYSDSARLKFKLEAPLEQKYENGDVWYRRGVLLTFYGPRGEVRNVLTGKVGHFDKAKNLYEVRGNVRIESQLRREKLDTEQLFYDQGKQQIYNDTTQFVRIETPAEVLTGKGLRANQDFSRYTLLQPTGTFTLKDAP